MLTLGDRRAACAPGFVPSHFEAFLTHRVEQDGPLTRGAGLELVREIGARARGQSARDQLHIPPEARARAEKLLRGGGIETPFMLVAPAPMRRTRARRAELAARDLRWNAALQHMAISWPLVVTPRPRSPKNTAETSPTPTAHPVVALRGKMDVLTLTALLVNARAVIGDDAGTLALADLLERPVVSATDLEELPQKALHRLGL